MKISDLKEAIQDVPDGADLYVYTGSGGTFVDAQWPDGGSRRIIDSPGCVPAAGGPTVSPAERAVKSVAGERARRDPDMIG